MRKPVPQNDQERELFAYIDSLTPQGRENFRKILEGMRDGTVSIENLPGGWGAVTFHDEPQEPENHLLRQK